MKHSSSPRPWHDTFAFAGQWAPFVLLPFLLLSPSFFPPFSHFFSLLSPRSSLIFFSHAL
jgi:hypothetical protein